MDQIRLNKFLAERLGLSRREADDAIATGKVFIDEKPAILGARIDKSSKVCYNRKIVPYEADFLYLAFNKPVGYVCSRRAQGGAPTLYELLPDEFKKLKTVGRLDKDSSGLILLTNDGDFAFEMTHPKFHKEKIYHVVLDCDLEPLHQQIISDYGVKLDDGVSKFKVIRDEEKDDRKHFTVILSEGRNRQIRRTFGALGYTVVELHRVSFGKYQLTDLEPGKYVIIKP
ncbi:MAG: pseudouridine synthase [Candidatus Saccharibacteria bacterium]|nr:pseudouridine synthase [Candidatus Saccharibacteria bacterium]